MNITFEFVAGQKLEDQDGRVYTVASVTTRVVVIERADGPAAGEWHESVSHAFARAKYRPAR